MKLIDLKNVISKDSLVGITAPDYHMKIIGWKEFLKLVVRTKQI